QGAASCRVLPRPAGGACGALRSQAEPGNERERGQDAIPVVETAMNTCPSTDTLEQFLGGALSDGEPNAIRSHVTACPRCQKILDELSDHPRLREWAAPSGSNPVLLLTDEPGLARVLETVRD